MPRPGVVFAGMIALALNGCGPATILPETKYLLSKPIDCRTAKQEMDLLAASRPGDFQKAATVVKSVEPMGAASGLISNDFDDRLRVIKGEHSDDIDRRIKELSQICKLPAPKMS